jgi:3-methyladenine DNA glycosylase AlkD
MNLENVLLELKNAGDSKTQAQYAKTDAAYAPYGIRMVALRAIAKAHQGDHALALSLIDAPALEARMLAAMIADPKQMDEATLTRWANATASTMFVDQALLDLVAATPFAWPLAARWIQDESEHLRYAGYQLYALLFRKEELPSIPLSLASVLLDRIASDLKKETKRVAYAMNNAVVMAGLHVPALETSAIAAAEAIGYVEPLRAKNDCNTQSALDYLNRYGNDPKYSRTAKLKKGSS